MERVSVPLVLILVVALPIGIILVVPRFLISQEDRYELFPSWPEPSLPSPATLDTEVNAVAASKVVSSTGVRAFAIAHSVTQVITTLIKNTLGRPRPDMLDRCKPTLPVSTPPVPGQVMGSEGLRNGLVTDSVCTAPLSSHVVIDGFRSFPSGHASTSFTGMVFLALFLDALLAHGTRSSRASTRALRLLSVTGCICLALHIAIGRIADHRHHPTDVLAGTLLGIIVAVMVYALYAPPLPVAPLFQQWSKGTTTTSPASSEAARTDALVPSSLNGSNDAAPNDQPGQTTTPDYLRSSRDFTTPNVHYVTSLHSLSNFSGPEAPREA